MKKGKLTLRSNLTAVFQSGVSIDTIQDDEGVIYLPLMDVPHLENAPTESAPKEEKKPKTPTKKTAPAKTTKNQKAKPSSNRRTKKQQGDVKQELADEIAKTFEASDDNWETLATEIFQQFEASIVVDEDKFFEIIQIEDEETSEFEMADMLLGNVEAKTSEEDSEVEEGMTDEDYFKLVEETLGIDMNDVAREETTLSALAKDDLIEIEFEGEVCVGEVVGKKARKNVVKLVGMDEEVTLDSKNCKNLNYLIPAEED
ncbi:hypothetical protein [Flammeovirga agarivorans]|uniref:Uncharacterized protein n=1 Tax=Flammeovirga agarivorans TaxID=2726742 RepID=A0A7X8XZ91_9BACT|nr:hypothetical protein [Flammeovirga agarivorans]NLR94939.1 hypothetical protein [Flammeovirga agarivorans]